MSSMHIFTESVAKREENPLKLDAQELRMCMRLDAKRFQEDTAHEWYSMSTKLRTFLLALCVTFAAYITYICVRSLP